MKFPLQAYSIVSMLFITAATVGCCLETIVEMQDENDAGFRNRCNTSFTFFVADVDHLIPQPSLGLRVLDNACNAFFTVQLAGRALVAPDRLAFLRSPITVINILALIPFYMLVVVHASVDHCDTHKLRFIIETVYVLSIIRVFRVFEILAHFEPFLVLVRALRSSLHELVILLIVVLTCIFVFGVLIFYAEGRIVNRETTVVDIPVGIWWAFVTITTVGYGDVAPTTTAGYVIGGSCALVGVVLLTLTIPILSSSFSFFYDHSRTRKEKPVTKKARQTTQVQLRQRRRKSAKTFPMEDNDEATTLIQDSSPSNDAGAATAKEGLEDISDGEETTRQPLPFKTVGHLPQE